MEHGSDSLLDLCPDESLEVINPHRLNVVTDREKISYDPAEMDNAADQIKKIQELHLPVDELDACNLMAFYLGWAIKRGQMSNPFLPVSGDSGGGPGRKGAGSAGVHPGQAGWENVYSVL